MRITWLLLSGAIALGGCDIGGPPAWTADYLVPLNFPSVDLTGVPGGVIPIDTVAVPTDVESQDMEGLVGSLVQSEDLVGLTAEVIVTTNLDVVGDLFVSVAPSEGSLFDPAQSLTAALDVRQGTDTTIVPVDLRLFQTADALYYQANLLVAGRTGNITVPAGARIEIRINFIGTVQVSE